MWKKNVNPSENLKQVDESFKNISFWHLPFECFVFTRYVYFVKGFKLVYAAWDKNDIERMYPERFWQFIECYLENIKNEYLEIIIRNTI